MDIDAVMVALARQRRVFHSEADFQQALAWEIHVERPVAEIRLEYRPVASERTYIDLWVETPEETWAIELKYKTRGLVVDIGRERFTLNSHAAQDITRYDVWKDVGRIERACAARDGVHGATILLTNDSAYWKEPSAGASIDLEFRLNEGRHVSGPLAWAATAGAGTTRGRIEPITLAGDYRVRWEHFSEVPAASYGEFRYLVLAPEGSSRSIT